MVYEHTFQTLKQEFTSAPILRHFDSLKHTVLETDACNFVIGAILSQIHEGHLYTVAYHSRKMSLAEWNYDIHDKELLAIVDAFKVWRYYCHEIPLILVFSDHQNLKYFMYTKVLNAHQTRWAAFLSHFNFRNLYRPGPQGEKPDTLS